MRGAPLSLSWKLGRHAKLTAGGIALCVAFSVLSFSVVQGLQGTARAVSPELQADAWVVSRPGFEPFDPLQHGLQEGTFILLATARLADGRNVTLAAYEARDVPPVASDAIRSAGAVNLTGRNVTLVAPSELTLTVGPPLSQPFLQAHWAVVAPATLRSLDASLPGTRVTYVLTGSLDEATRERLHAAGLDAQPVPAVLPFFQAGAREVGADLWLIVAFSSVLVAILAFEFMHFEVRQRRREMGIWRALGIRAHGVLLILLARASLLTLAGVGAGSAAAMGAVLLAKRATGLAILQPVPDPLLLGGVAGATLAATLLGALLPAAQASRAPIRDSLEAAP